jgi:hypothetical protein
MEARIFRAVVTTALILVATSTQAGSFRTRNFVVKAPTSAMAEQIGRAAEQYRKELAIEWLGTEMRPWGEPCPIEAQVAPHLGAGGATSFLFDRGEVYGWQMTIQGSLERILDSVLPHEVTHTVFATHFRCPLPRWADEGACTTVEHASERNKQQVMLVDFLQTGRGIPFSKMFAMKDYPADVMPLYSQGYSLARFLISQGGKAKFLAFVGDGLRDKNWPRAVDDNYGFKDLGHLQNSWLDWVRQGSPPLDRRPPSLNETPVVLASNQSPRRSNEAPKRSSSASPYPTDDDLPMRSIKRATGEEPRSKVAASAPKTRTASWQPRKSAFLVPDDTEDESKMPAPREESYARDEPVPGPSPTNPDNHQVTRPQPTEQARQIILEWSRP